MDLICPHCTKRVALPDEKAGQVAACPLCAKQFMAPSLAPPPFAPAPPPVPSAPAPVETFGLGPVSAPPPSVPSPIAPVSASSKPDPVPPPPPVPPGEYTGACSCELTGAWLLFVPPACVFVIFVLSFFAWHSQVPDPTLDQINRMKPGLSLWSLSFTDQGQAQFLVYTILMFLCFPLSLAAALFDRNILFTPPQLAPVLTFKSLVVGLFLGVAFLMLCVDYLQAHFGSQPLNPIALPFKLAFRLHLLAIIASFLMFWLNWRKRRNLPPPKCDWRW